MQKFLRTLMLLALLAVPFASQAQTNCTGLTIPYAENFDAYTGNSTGTTAPTGYPSITLPECWSFLNMSASTSTYPQAFLTSSTTYAVSGNCLFFKSKKASSLYAILPDMGAQSGAWQLSFQYRNEGTTASNGTLIVGVMSDPTDSTSFVALETLPRTTTKTLVELAIPAGTVTSGTRLAFCYEGGTSNNYYASIDDVTLDAAPTCFKVTNLAIDANTITNNSMTLTWTDAQNTGATYTVYNGEDVVATGINGTSYTVTGLNGNTIYTFGVVANCSATDASAIMTVSGRTACDDTQALPYVEEFSGYTGLQTTPYYGPSTIPACWGFYSNGTNTAETSGSTAYYGGVAQSTGTSYGSLEANNPYLYMPIQLVGQNVTNATQIGYGEARGNTKIAILPAFATALSGLQISFDYKMSTAYSATGAAATLEIGYVTDDIVFVSMQSYQAVTAIQQVVDLNLSTLAADAPAGARLAFKFSGVHNGTGTSSYSTVYCGIDNIHVETLPNCARITNLEVASVTSSSITLSWTDTINSSATYTVYNMADTSVVVSGIAPSPAAGLGYTVTGLTANTEYTFGVVANCSATDQSAINVISGTTACAAMALPWTCGFEESEIRGTAQADALPWCTERYIDPNATSGTTYPYSISGNAHEGSRSLYFYGTTSTTYPAQMAIKLPGVDVTTYPMNGNRLIFWAKMSSATASKVVYIGTTDLEEGGVLDSVMVSGNTYTKYTIPLTASAANAPYVVVVVPRGTGTLYMDDMTLEVMPSCVDVTNLTASVVTSNSVTLTWSDANNNGATYTVYNMADTSVVATNVSGMTYTVTGLTAITEYTFGVEANCSAAEASAMTTVSVRTECNAEVMPFTEDFSATLANDICWRGASNATAAQVFAGTALSLVAPSWTYTSSARDGLDAGHYYKNVYGTAVMHWMITPPIDLTNATSAQLSFDVALTDYNNAALPDANGDTNTSQAFMVIVSTDGGNTWSANNATVWQNVDGADYTYASLASTTYQTKVINLNQYLGQTIKIAFYCQSLWSGGDNDLHLDNIAVTEVPSCPAVLDLTASNITANGVTLTWTGDADGYSVICTSANGVATTTSVTTESITLTGLAANTEYITGVVANCGNDNSDTTYVTFRTACDAVAVPFTETFEDASSSRACWSTEGPGNWTIGTGDYSTSTGAFEGSLNAKITHGITGDVTKLISPVLAIADTTMQLRLTFAHIQRMWGSDQDTMRVYFRTSAIDNWIMAAEYTDNIQNWTVENVSLPGSTYQVAFEMTDGYGYGVGIDSVVFSLRAVCEAPVITINSNSNRDVNFSWTCPGDSVYIALFDNDGTQVYGHFYGPNDTVFSYNLPEQSFPFGYVYIGAMTICGAVEDQNYSESVYDYFFVTCDAEEQCPVTFVLNAPTSDGWNGAGAALDIYDTVSGLIVASMGSLGATYTTTYNLCADRVYSVMVRTDGDNTGSLSGLSFQIYGLDSTVYANVTNPTVGVQGYFTHSCTITPDSVNITIAVNDATMGTTVPAPGTHTYAVGDEISVTAVPNAGYHVADWQMSIYIEGYGTYTDMLGDTSLTISDSVYAEYDGLILTAMFAADVIECDPMTLPFTETFDSISTTRDCWTTDGPGTWQFGAYSNTAPTYQGASYAYIRHSSSGNVTKLISPALSVSADATALQLTFAHVQKVWSGDQDQMRVYYRTSATDSWVMAAEYTTDIQTWTVENVTIPANAYQVAFEMTDGYGYGVAVDSVVITEMTASFCFAPSGLNVTLTPGNGTVAELAWTAGDDETAWQICLNGDTTTLIDVTTNPYTLTGLTPEVPLTAMVRAYCSATSQSTWSNTVNFTPTNAYSITVADGQNTNGFVPVYGYYADAYLNAQMVYPASSLATIAGQDITQLTYYATQASVNWGTANFKVYMAETADTAISAFTDVNTMTLVYDGSLGITDNMMVVTLDDAFHYTGSNLLVAVIEDATGSYVTSTWYGVNTDGASVQGYSYNSVSEISPAQRNFIPKTTFNYATGVAPSCVRPTGLNVAYNGGTTATVSWISDANSFNLDVNGTVTSNVTNPYTLTGLSLATDYTVKVQANCGADTSEWTNPVTFHTDNCLPTDQCQITIYAQDSYGDGWNGNAIDVIQNGVTVATYSMASQNLSQTVIYDTAVITVCSGMPISFNWVVGSYAYETSFMIANANGTVVSSRSGSDMVAGEFLSLDNCTAMPTLDSMKVTVAVNDATMGTTVPAPGVHYFYEGDTCSVVAVPNTGYHLLGWTLYVTENGDPVLDTTLNYAVDNVFDLFQGGWVVSHGDSRYEWNVTANFEADPTCMPVTNLTVDAATLNSVTISWTDSLNTSASYTVYNMADNTVVATGIAGTTYTVTGLTPATAYTFGVVANCSADDASSMATIAASTGCGVINVFPYTEDFTSMPACWSTIDADGDGYNWENLQGAMHSASYDNNFGVLYPDNWLITPQFQLTAGVNYEVTWNANPQDTSWPAEHYGLYVSTTTADTTAFTLIQDWTLTAAGHVPVIDLSSYAGQTIYLAFRHWNCSDMFRIAIDNFQLRQQASANQITVTLTQNNPMYGSVAGGGVYTIGDSVTVTATAASGYQFESWVDAANVVVSTANPYTFVAATNVTLEAIFGTGSTPQNPDSMLVNVAVNNASMGTTIPAPGAHYFYEGDSAHVYAVPNTGYYLEGWSINVVSSGLTLMDTTFNYPVTDVFDIFGGWEVEAGDGDYVWTVTANFAAGAAPVMHDSVIVTTSVNDSTMGTVVPAPGTHYYVDGDVFNFSILPNAGYEVLAVTITESYMGQTETVTLTDTADIAELIDEFDGIDIDEDMYGLELSIHVIFAPVGSTMHTVTLMTNDATMGTVDPAGTTMVADGATFTATATALTGNHFVGWYDATGTVVSTNATYVFTVTDDVILMAVFEANGGETYYEVTVSYDQSRGRVDGAGSYVAGSNVSLQAYAFENYEFVAWLDENGDTLSTNTAYAIANLQSNRALTALFQPKTGIADVDMENVKIYSTDNVIVVRGAEGKSVVLFDVNGRMLSREASAAERVEFRVSNSGVYLVKVANAAAKRVVVIR